MRAPLTGEPFPPCWARHQPPARPTLLSPHRAPAPGTCSRTCWGSTWWHRGSRRHRHSGSTRCPGGRSCSPCPEGPPPRGCGSSTQAFLRDTAAGMLGRGREQGPSSPPGPQQDPNGPSPVVALGSGEQRHPEHPCPRDVPQHSPIPIAGSDLPGTRGVGPARAIRGMRAARRRRRRRQARRAMVPCVAGSGPRLRQAGI